jgi:hypothetical protein
MQERQTSSLSSEDNDEVHATILHKELLRISNKSLANRNRFHNAVEPTADENKNTKQSNHFLQVTKEKSMFNQYWYSEHTIQVLVEAIEELCKNYGIKRIAFLSTPSLYFALPKEKREHCKLFEVSS